MQTLTRSHELPLCLQYMYTVYNIHPLFIDFYLLPEEAGGGDRLPPETAQGNPGEGEDREETGSTTIRSLGN